jgi:hypothetical protein
MFYRGTVMPQHEVAASARWSKTPCIIATSEVIREDNGESADTFRPGVRFRYRDPGTRTERLGGKFNFNPTSASDPTLPGAIVAHYPTGTLTYCYVDPEHPETAVLQRSMGERKGAGAIALGLVLAGSIGLFSGLLLPKRAPGVSPDAAMLLKLRAIQHSGSAAGYPPPPARRGPVLYRSTELRQQRFVSSFSVALACATATVTIGWANSLFWGNFVVWLVAGVLAVIAISQFLISFKRLWKLSTPSINIGFARPLEPGTAVELRWAFTGRSSTRIDLLALALIGHEEATYTRGTDTITDRRAMPEEPLLEVPHAGRLGEGKCMVNLSPRHMHTFTSRNNVLRWELRVRCSSGRSTTEDLIPVIIYPTGVTR